MCFIEYRDPTGIQDNDLVVFNEVTDDESSNSDMDVESSNSDSDDEFSNSDSESEDQLLNFVSDLCPDDFDCDEIIFHEDDSIERDAVEDFVLACSEKQTIHPPDLIFTNEVIGDLTFHPKTNIIATGLSNGEIYMCKYSNEKNEYLKTYNKSHLTYVINLEFNETGDKIYSVCVNNDVAVTDAETGQLSVVYNKAHIDETHANVLSVIDENSFATGDENGYVKVWDVRVNRCRFSLKANEFGINSILTLNKNSGQPTLVCPTDDGVLAIIDVLSHQIMLQTEDYYAPLSSCVSIKQNTKLVSGTAAGKLITFDSENYGLLKDQFLNFGFPVSTLIQVTEDIVLCGLHDGRIRASSMFPNCHLGMIGQQEDKPIHRMNKSNTGHLIASSQLGGKNAKFWNIEFLENYDVQKHKEKINQKK